MLLSFDVAPDAIVEHDEWHTHEHLPERLSIPGFVRGTRWIARDGAPRYFVMYEVEHLATLTSEAYLERLDFPSPWTSRMMSHYRGMRRGFCTVSGSFGDGLGHAGGLVRFRPAAGAEVSLRRWLLDGVLPDVPSRPGIGSAHLFEGASTPPMTNEQRIRGADAGVDWALFVTGYDADAVAELMRADPFHEQLDRHGATDVHAMSYQLAYALIAREVGVRPSTRDDPDHPSALGPG